MGKKSPNFPPPTFAPSIRRKMPLVFDYAYVIVNGGSSYLTSRNIQMGSHLCEWEADMYVYIICKPIHSTEYYTGSNRAQHTANKFGKQKTVRECIFVFWGFYHSQIANSWFRTCCNTRWIILGASENVPLIYYRNTSNAYKKTMDTLYKNISFVNLGIWHLDMCWQPAYQYFVK